MDQPANDIVLKFDRVTVAFDDVEVLKEVGFEVPHGETRVIFGAAGSGKTVLLKTALGLVRPVSGHVYLFGQDIKNLPEHELFAIRSKLGMLFQESALFDSLTIEENVAYPLVNQVGNRRPESEVNKRVRDALRFVGLEDTLDKFPSELSGGMRRRAAIARAVVTEPALLLYDSPTAGLDPITANTILTLIVRQRDLRRTTTLIVTHRYQNGNILANFRYVPDTGQLAPVRDGDHIGRTKFLGFKDGKLIFEGTQAELEASTDAYVRKFVGHNG